LKQLRVCARDSIESYNCGQCEKCYRTVLILALLGIPPQQTSFPNSSFDLVKIAKFINASNLRDDLKSVWSLNMDFLLSSHVELEGKEMLKKSLENALGEYYIKYKSGDMSNLHQVPISSLHKLERFLCLKPDSLLWIKRIIRLFHSRAYWKFIKTHGHLQKI